jgi:Ca-activated chloride channel family protein
MVKMVGRTQAPRDIRDAEVPGFYQATTNGDIAAIPFDDYRPYQFGPVKDWEPLTKLRRDMNDAATGLKGVLVDEALISYPDPEVWRELIERRKKNWDAFQESERVQQSLRQPISLNFRELPLAEVTDEIGKLLRMKIRFDPGGLDDAGVAADTPITLQLTQDISVKSALRLILEPLHLGYVIEHGAIKITSEKLAGEGRGPGEGGDRYSRIIENPFLGAAQNPLSTFSIDVDTASYAKVRRYLLEENRLPPPDAVRIEELVNYFSYDLPQPEGEAPLAAKLEAAACPWQPKHRLLRVSLKAREIAPEARPAANLVFLLDVSGSMEPDDKLPRVRRAMRLLAEQLREQDRVAIVVYAGSSGLVLPSTSGFQKGKILSALESLAAGGSTNGSEGLVLAYETAAASFIKGGVNRVILCTDGDFNVGVTSDGDLERLIEDKARSGVFLTVLGFGMGNHNDQMLEKLADKGNGNYGYIDTEDEARKLLVEQAGGTLVTVAKDVKLQLEFNPRQVAAYRLIGYEDRLLRPEDFNDDRKDAGEIGAGHAVTALYELIPAERPAAAKDAAGGEDVIEPLKYQRAASLTDAADSGELLSLKVKYKAPDAEKSKEALEFTLRDDGQGFAKASADFKFAAAVASFGMLLRDSEYKGDFSYDAVLEIAREGLGADEQGYRKAFLEMVRKAKELAAAKGR